jgi:hypothetical protein
MDKLDKWNGTLLLDEVREEVKALEDQVAKYLDEAKDPTFLHEECPLLFVILEDLEHVGKRVKKARKQMAEARS